MSRLQEGRSCCPLRVSQIWVERRALRLAITSSLAGFLLFLPFLPFGLFFFPFRVLSASRFLLFVVLFLSLVHSGMKAKSAFALGPRRAFHVTIPAIRPYQKTEPSFPPLVRLLQSTMTLFGLIKSCFTGASTSPSAKTSLEKDVESITGSGSEKPDIPPTKNKCDEPEFLNPSEVVFLLPLPQSTTAKKY